MPLLAVSLGLAFLERGGGGGGGWGWVGIGGGGGEGGYRWGGGGVGTMKKKEGVKMCRELEVLCEKGWRVSCSLMAFFFSGARGRCDDVRVGGWVALIFFFGSGKFDGFEGVLA